MKRHTTRRAFAAVAAAGLAGCSEGQGGETGTSSSPTASDNPAVGDVEQMEDLRLTSPAFEDGEPIPEKYGRNAEDVNPPLSITGVPEEAESLVLIMDDPDAVDPAGEVWLHWLVWNVPASTTEIAEDWEPTEATVGTNDFDEQGYGGPTRRAANTPTGSNSTRSIRRWICPNRSTSAKWARRWMDVCWPGPNWKGRSHPDVIAGRFRPSALFSTH